MSILLEYVGNGERGRIIAADDLPAATWNRISALVTRVEAEALISGRVIELHWSSVLAIAARLADLRRSFHFQIQYSPEAREHLKRFKAEHQRIHGATLADGIAPNSLQEILFSRGFIRELKDHQKPAIAQLLNLPHGANFSVPGAGKTTVALAVNSLVGEGAILFVVAPKNAFTAWDEGVQDCFDPGNSKASVPFQRLEGGADSVRDAFRSAYPRMIISYDQFIRVPEMVADFLRLHRVHFVVDESHRMKAGSFSQRGAALLSVAHLPFRRDILSGTPIPNSIQDISPQIDFLWPGQGLGRRIAESKNPGSILRPLYVRTTKKQLALPPVNREFVSVPMSKPQLVLYSLLRDALLAQSAGLKATGNVDIVSARRSVMRLLQVSSNPMLAVKALTLDAPELFPYSDPMVGSIFRQVVEECDSPKLRKCVELTEEFLSENKREHVVIWSTFRESVERLADILSSHGATYIHGDVPTGSTSDPDTREGRLARFHNLDSDCRVLVANPAACSEGISLHRVCHNAIYLDRSYNAAHYLQSVDRIHRLGLEDNVLTRVRILESTAPGGIGSIDFSVRRRLIAKLQIMSQALEDEDLRQLAIDEQAADDPIDYGIEREDVLDLIDEMMGIAPVAGDEDAG